MSAVSSEAANLTDESVDVVVVDDNQLTLDIVSWIFRGADTRFELFKDHQVALNYLTNETPKVLIIDYFMPGINGVEFLLQLNTLVDMPDTRKYLCSAASPELSDQRSMSELNVEILGKEVICDKASLLALVDECCQ